MNKRKLHYILSAVALSWAVSLVRVYIHIKSPVTELEAYLPEIPQLSFSTVFTYLFQ